MTTVREIPVVNRLNQSALATSGSWSVAKNRSGVIRRKRATIGRTR